MNGWRASWGRTKQGGGHYDIEIFSREAGVTHHKDKIASL